jgi:hypothetical protein
VVISTLVVINPGVQIQVICTPPVLTVSRPGTAAARFGAERALVQRLPGLRSR